MRIPNTDDTIALRADMLSRSSSPGEPCSYKELSIRFQNFVLSPGDSPPEFQHVPSYIYPSGRIVAGVEWAKANGHLAVVAELAVDDTVDRLVELGEVMGTAVAHR